MDTGLRRYHKTITVKMFYVYPLASKPYGTLYVGVTSDLVKRVFEHKSKAVPGFAARYRVDTLVWFEGTLTRTGPICIPASLRESNDRRLGPGQAAGMG